MGANNSTPLPPSDSDSNLSSSSDHDHEKQQQEIEIEDVKEEEEVNQEQDQDLPDKQEDDDDDDDELSRGKHEEEEDHEVSHQKQEEEKTGVLNCLLHSFGGGSKRVILIGFLVFCCYVGMVLISLYMFTLVYEFEASYGTQPNYCLSVWKCVGEGKKTERDEIFAKEASAYYDGVPGKIPSIDTGSQIKCDTEKGILCLVLPYGTTDDYTQSGECIPVNWALAVADHGGMTCTKELQNAWHFYYNLLTFGDQVRSTHFTIGIVIGVTFVLLVVVQVVCVRHRGRIMVFESFWIPLVHFICLITIAVAAYMYEGFLDYSYHGFFCCGGGGNENCTFPAFYPGNLTIFQNNTELEDNVCLDLDDIVLFSKVSVGVFMVVLFLVPIPMFVRSQWQISRGEPDPTENKSGRLIVLGTIGAILSLLTLTSSVSLYIFLNKAVYDWASTFADSIVSPVTAIVLNPGYSVGYIIFILIAVTSCILAFVLSVDSCRDKRKLGGRTTTRRKNNCFQITRENRRKLKTYAIVFIALGLFCSLILVVVGVLFVLAGYVLGLGCNFLLYAKPINTLVQAMDNALKGPTISSYINETLEEASVKVCEALGFPDNSTCEQQAFQGITNATASFYQDIYTVLIHLDNGGIYCLDLRPFNSTLTCDSTVYDWCTSITYPMRTELLIIFLLAVATNLLYTCLIGALPALETLKIQQMKDY